MTTAAAHRTYEELRTGFTWAAVERELGWAPPDRINIGWYCSDRICRLGLARKRALLWEDFAGHARTYTFDDLRVLSNTVARFLSELGIAPGERVCLFLDRIPELYLSFLGILKMGGVAQPLFSAFGDESLWTRLADAGTAAILTQRRHLPKVRKIREKLPSLRKVIVVDAAGGAMQEREVPMALDALPRVEELEVFPS
ncbi:MAG TPA: AMP-binding protein, partial [Thermoanaerobaculia bacterium]